MPMPYADPWAAPYAAVPVDAAVELPGSKSVTNRALVLAALATGVSRIRGPLRSRDTDLMAAGLRALGVRVDDEGSDWVVTGQPGALYPGGRSVDVGLAGTVARFLPPLATLAVGSVTFDGDARMRERPMAPLFTALRALGADIKDSAGRLPATVHGRGRVAGGSVSIDASASSQLVSGLLLTAPRYDDGLTLAHEGATLPSQPHITMTVELMRRFGATVDVADSRWHVPPSAYSARDVEVEPDLSGASPFLAAAAATGGVVRIPSWPASTVQPGAALPGLLERMGCALRGGLELQGPSALHGLDADLADCPELLPALAALAALASTPSRLTGVAHVRHQETDRLVAVATELNRLGGDVAELPDGLVITPRPLHATEPFRTYDDHRLAMCAAVLGLVVPDLLVENVATTNKTMPDFVERWMGMLS